jgi:hypothetical protein
MNRDEAFERLMEPLVINQNMRLEGARLLVGRARDRVNLVLPFLSSKEAATAKQWLADNSFDHLWDENDQEEEDE